MSGIWGYTCIIYSSTTKMLSISRDADTSKRSWTAQARDNDMRCTISWRKLQKLPTIGFIQLLTACVMDQSGTRAKFCQNYFTRDTSMRYPGIRFVNCMRVRCSVKRVIWSSRRGKPWKWLREPPFTLRSAKFKSLFELKSFLLIWTKR